MAGSTPILFERVRYTPYGRAEHRWPGDFNEDGAVDLAGISCALPGSGWTEACNC